MGCCMQALATACPCLRSCSPSAVQACLLAACNSTGFINARHVQEYTFTLTYGDGRRFPGFCRQFLPPPPKVGGRQRYPQVMCLISDYPWCALFFKVGDHMLRRCSYRGCALHKACMGIRGACGLMWHSARTEAQFIAGASARDASVGCHSMAYACSLPCTCKRLPRTYQLQPCSFHSHHELIFDRLCCAGSSGARAASQVWGCTAGE